MKEINKGDIVTFEGDEGEKWIILFRDWYKPYYGHIHYFALYDGKEMYYKHTCFIMDEDALRPSTRDEKDFILNKCREDGYVWDNINKKLCLKNVKD